MVTKANEAINWLFFLIEGNLINDVNQSLLRNSLLAPGRKCNAARDSNLKTPLAHIRLNAGICL